MKACVLGCGVSGKGALSLLKSKGYDLFGIDKQKGFYKGIPIFLEEEATLEGIELFVVSPGIPSNHKLVKEAQKKNIPIKGEIELGLSFLKNICLAVTGTNGKTTTALLMTHILKACHIPVICLGNSGTSLCEKVEELSSETIVVLELSSYQIQSIQSRKIYQACILNIEEDHILHHGSFVEYAKAKLRLSHFVKEKIFINKSILQKVDFKEENKIFLFDKQQIVATLNELGYTNNEALGQENLFAAWQMLKGFVNKEQFKQGVLSFAKPKYRLEKIGMHNNIEIYNDSKSTNPASVFFAIEAMQKHLVLLLGGEDKGSSFKKILEKKEQIRQVICFGKSALKVAQELKSLKPEVVNTVKQAAEQAFFYAKKGDAILFSPGGSSFDAFTDYKDRGSFFTKEILQIIGDRT